MMKEIDLDLVVGGFDKLAKAELQAEMDAAAHGAPPPMDVPPPQPIAVDLSNDQVGYQLGEDGVYHRVV